MNAGNQLTQMALYFCVLGLCAVSVQAQTASGPVTGEPYNPFNVKVDPYNVVNQVAIEEGKPGRYSSKKLSEKNILKTDFKRERKKDEYQEQKTEVISPVLQHWLAERDPGTEVEVIITLAETMQIPLLPDLQPGESREGKTRRGEVIEQLREQRRKDQ